MLSISISVLKGEDHNVSSNTTLIGDQEKGDTGSLIYIQISKLSPLVHVNALAFLIAVHRKREVRFYVVQSILLYGVTASEKKSE